MVYIYILIILLFFIGACNFIIYKRQWSGVYPVEDIDVKSRYRQFLCLFCSALLIVLHGYVNPAYSDLNVYIGYLRQSRLYSYNEILTGDIPGFRMEVGYRLYTKIISDISISPLFFLLVTGFLLTLGYYKTIRKYSPYIIVSFLFILTGPFFQSLFVLRQHLAMSIILLTYPYIIDRKIVPYILLFLLAYSFHQTAIIFFPIYFLYSIKKLTKIVFIYLTGGVVLMFTMVLVLQFYVSNLTDDTLSYNLSSYGLSEEGMNIKRGLLMSGLLVFRFIVMKSKSFEPGINKLLTIILLTASVAAFVFMGVFAGPRLLLYFTGMFLVLPNTVAYVKTPVAKVATVMVFWTVSLYMMIGQTERFADSSFWIFSPYLSII